MFNSEQQAGRQRPGLYPSSSVASFQVPPSPSMPGGLQTNATSYLAVILAGPGEGLFPLINNQSAELDEPDHQPTPQIAKAGLPLLNRPIIEFTLDWIEESGLTEVLILASESQRSCLSSITKTRKSSSSTTTQNLTIKLECIPDIDFISHGTSGSLRWAINRNLIKTAFVLLPCDLYFQSSRSTSDRSILNCSQVDPIYERTLLAIVERHRTNQNLITTVFYERQANTLDLRDGPSLNLVTLDPRSGVLLNLQELDGFGSEMEIRMKMIDRFPTCILSSALVPAHVFVCSPAVIDLLLGLPQLASFKHQFVPWLAKNQWQPGLLKKTAVASTKLDLPSDPLTEAFMRSSTNPTPQSNRGDVTMKGQRTPLTAASTPPISRTFSCLSLDARADQFATQPLSQGSLKSAFNKIPPALSGAAFRCEYVIWPAKDGFVCRANSVPGYAEINRTALKLEHERQQAAGNRPTGPPTPGVGTAGADSLVGPNVSLLDKSSVKKSIVGRGCTIGKASKVVNSVLMERVSIGEHVKIENCILTNGVIIGDRVELKDCEVESGTVIEADFVTKGEKIARC
ncbi:hypothetical protein PGT21_015796 [Puccinia graminis f. sp. tritici]|uniref:Translation initiation factor eIF2B subunit gamma n=1 Tax=Puccinia graminis f. sp. tritici TaxID=56615 RepID=A0A5B0SFT4_PUCGR|nr:hypothetical protein PGT21_015796 [Puccinia graminis f. sp. tritici]KAA1136692.1 hypothetical protein PGTUg99_037159 [Puccinia graminis f. sp. tritici]